MQLGFMPPECLAGIAVAVSDDEMRVNMCGIRVDCKQHIITLAEKEFGGKVFCNVICLLMCQTLIILRVKRNGNFVSKVLLSVNRFSECFACQQYLLRKMIAVTVERIIEMIFGFDYTVPDLRMQSAENVITGAFQLCDGLARLVIHLDITEHC